MSIVALSGAGGFIGTHLARRLHERGDRVLTLRRERDGSLVIPSGTERVDAVIHLAFPVDPPVRRNNPPRIREEVETGARSAADVAKRFGAKRLLLASSGKIYGANVASPIREDSPTRPNTFLGELKLLAERTIANAIAGGPVEALSLRIFNCYGPGQGHGFLIPKLIQGVRRGSLVLGELHHRRDWIHVDDVVDAMLTALVMPATPGELLPLNVGTGRATDVAGLLEILRHADIPIPEPRVNPELCRPDEATEERADSSRLRAAGWNPAVSLEDGLIDLFRVSLRREEDAGV